MTISTRNGCVLAAGLALLAAVGCDIFPSTPTTLDGFEGETWLDLSYSAHGSGYDYVSVRSSRNDRCVTLDGSQTGTLNGAPLALTSAGGFNSGNGQCDDPQFKFAPGKVTDTVDLVLTDRTKTIRARWTGLIDKSFDVVEPADGVARAGEEMRVRLSADTDSFEPDPILRPSISFTFNDAVGEWNTNELTVVVPKDEPAGTEHVSLEAAIRTDAVDCEGTSHCEAYGEDLVSSRDVAIQSGFGATAVGSVFGAPFQAADALASASACGTIALPPLASLVVSMADQPGMCMQLQRGRVPDGDRILTVGVFRESSRTLDYPAAIQTGTYALGPRPSAPDADGMRLWAGAFVGREQNGCQYELATSGTLTFSSIVADAVSGSFDIVLAGGERVQGNFNALFCDAAYSENACYDGVNSPSSGTCS